MFIRTMLDQTYHQSCFYFIRVQFNVNFKGRPQSCFKLSKKFTWYLWLTILGILYIGISSVIQPLGCSLHSTKLSDQVYLYQADFRHSYCQRMTYRTLWEPWEATALLIQWHQPKVDPLSPQNQLRQAHLRFH